MCFFIDASDQRCFYIECFINILKQWHRSNLKYLERKENLGSAHLRAFSLDHCTSSVSGWRCGQVLSGICLLTRSCSVRVDECPGPDLMGCGRSLPPCPCPLAQRGALRAGGPKAPSYFSAFDPGVPVF